MGLIRNFLTVIVGVLLFFSVFSINLFGILSSSLTYENVYRESSVVFEDILSEVDVNSVIEERYPEIVLFCQNNSEFVFMEGNYVFEIPCEAALEGTEAIIEEGIKSVVREIYYENYSLSPDESIDELKDSPFFLISEKMHNSTKKIFSFSIFLSVILLIALFFLVDNKSNAFLIPGIYLALTSLLFFKIDSLFSIFSEGIILKILGIFFSTSFSVSIRLLILGILLIIIAVVFKVFKLGFWISNITEKLSEKFPKKSETKTEVKQLTKKK